MAIGGLFVTDAPVWLVVALALAPDLGMLGYLRSPAVGALTYNLFHWYPVPLAVATAGAWYSVELLLWVGLIWIAHIGIDRAVGYGMKYDDAFSHTHLSDAEPIA